MGTRYHSQGKGGGTPRSDGGVLRQLEKSKGEVERDMKMVDHKKDPQSSWKINYLSREQLKKDINKQKQYIALKMDGVKQGK